MFRRASATTLADSSPLAGVFVTVKQAGGALASIYDDDGGVLSNPLLTNEDGTFAYNVSSEGVYTEEYRFTSSGSVRKEIAVEIREDDNVRTDLNSTASGKGAALVGTKQAFIGAVARTQADKNADVVSVRDAGAVGGINGPFPDDTAAIQAAIDAQGTYSIGLGKTVYIPNGLYKLTGTLTTENIQRIHGDGPRQSILYNEQDPIPTIPAFTASGSLVFSTFEGFGARSQKSFVDVTEDTDQNTFRDLHIYDAADAAFRFRGIFQTTVFERVEIDACENGIVSETTICNLVTARDVSFKDMAGTSIDLAGSQSAMFSGTRFEGAGEAAKYVVDIDGAHQLIFDGGYAESCHKTFLRWTGEASGVVVFQNFHWTYFSEGVPFLWDVVDGGQLVFINCESSVAMEVPSNSILLGHNKNIYRANPSIDSASVITLPQAVPVVSITGTTTIDAITGDSQNIGYPVTLLFAAAATLRDVSTGGNCHLAGGANFAASANDTLTVTFDGSTWIEVSRNQRRASPQVVAQSAVAASHTGDTTETTLATITIPAGLLGANGQVEIETLWSYPNSANNKIQRVRFGGTLVQGLTRTTTQSSQQRVRVSNRNAENSQVAQAGGIEGAGAQNAAVTSLTVDTSAAVDITITGQLASASETITLESYRVIAWPKV